MLETLRDEILTGQYRPGERLPSERELAARFETSRGVVREALKKLEQLGIAAIHPGGVRVQALHEASLDVIGPLLDLQEVPDRLLVDQVAELMGLLVSRAASQAVTECHRRGTGAGPGSGGGHPAARTVGPGQPRAAHGARASVHDGLRQPADAADRQQPAPAVRRPAAGARISFRSRSRVRSGASCVISTVPWRPGMPTRPRRRWVN
ncbi:MAG: winged helix-turn-helix domain-containing protein [Gammaproteobacteria bacterium]|nr:winged helix-turn-helix domain-containing protein [Gammaproteobacteria bacterium]